MKPLRDASIFALVGAMVALLLEYFRSSELALSPTFMAIFVVTTAMRYGVLLLAGFLGCIAVLTIRRDPPDSVRLVAPEGAAFGVTGYCVLTLPSPSLGALQSFLLLLALAVLLALIPPVRGRGQSAV